MSYVRMRPRQHPTQKPAANTSKPKRKRTSNKENEGDDAFERFQSAIKKLQLKQQQNGNHVIIGVLESKNKNNSPDIPIYSTHSTITIGRSPSNSVAISFESLSSLHCTLKLSFNQIGNIEITIIDNSTNGTYIDSKKIEKGNELQILDNQTLSLYQSKKDTGLNIEYIYKENMNNVVSFQSDALKLMILADIKIICEEINVDAGDQEVSKLPKDKLLEVFRSTRIRNYNFERLSIKLNDYDEHPSGRLLPSNVIEKILSYCWYQPTMDLYRRRGDHVWKLSLNTISREFFHFVKDNLFNSLSLINNPNYFYYKDSTVRFSERILHPCNPLSTIYKLEIQDTLLYELLNFKKSAGLSREKPILDQVQVLILHHVEGFHKKLEDPSEDSDETIHYGRHRRFKRWYDYKVELPGVRKLKTINSEKQFQFIQQLSFPNLLKFDGRLDQSDRYNICHWDLTQYYMSYLQPDSFKSDKGLYEYGFGDGDSGFDIYGITGLEIEIKCRKYSVKRSLFKDNFSIPDTVREVEVTDLMTMPNFISIIKSRSSIQPFKYLIFYFENLEDVDKIKQHLSSSNSNFIYSHYTLKPISFIRKPTYKIYIYNTKFVQDPNENYLAEKQLIIDAIEKKKIKDEQDRLEKERMEKERLENEKLEKERLEKERLEKERSEKERLENEKN